MKYGFVFHDNLKEIFDREFTFIYGTDKRELAEKASELYIEKIVPVIIESAPYELIDKDEFIDYAMSGTKMKDAAVFFEYEYEKYVWGTMFEIK